MSCSSFKWFYEDETITAAYDTPQPTKGSILSITQRKNTQLIFIVLNRLDFGTMDNYLCGAR